MPAIVELGSEGLITCLVPTDSFISDPYAVGGSGLQVRQANYNLTAFTWEIDVAFSKSSPSAVIALYLPRADTGPDGNYTAQFNNTFLPSNFPCSSADLTAKAATTCCLSDFTQRYRVISSFKISTNNSLCLSPYSSPPTLLANDSVIGPFGDGLPLSSVALLPPAPGQADGVQLARVYVLHTALRVNASRFSGSVGVVERMETFVGLAQVCADQV
jgi:hypothetical protein